jgi:hypothetical protein
MNSSLYATSFNCPTRPLPLRKPPRAALFDGIAIEARAGPAAAPSASLTELSSNAAPRTPGFIGLNGRFRAENRSLIGHLRTFAASNCGPLAAASPGRCTISSPSFAQSMKLHVSAPSNFRTLTPASSIGSKFRALMPTFEPTLDSIGSQCVAQPQTLQCIVRMVRGPQTYWAVFSGCPQSSTDSNSYKAQSAPLRLQMLQLQSMRYSGDEGTMIRTAPQWQLAWGMATMDDVTSLT